jgi:hypothetical protein
VQEAFLTLSRVKKGVTPLFLRKKKRKNRQSAYKRNIEARRRDPCCRGKTIITYSECVFVDLIIRHAKRMRRIVLASMALSGFIVFFTFCHKRHDFGGGGGGGERRLLNSEKVF